MLRKILFFILFSLCCGLSARAWTDSPSRCAPIVVDAVGNGRYEGLMDVSMGEEKTFKGRKAVFVLKDGMLLCDFPKIGKMPGKIRIELPVKVMPDGKMVAQTEAVAGVMVMPMGFKIKLKLEALSEGKVTRTGMCFLMKVYGKFMGMKFPTSVCFQSVHFQGAERC